MPATPANLAGYSGAWRRDQSFVRHADIVGPIGTLEVYFHEAGHAVVGQALGISPTGGVEIFDDGGVTHFRPHTRSDNPAAVVVTSLAGNAAFNRAFPKVTDRRSLSDADLLTLLDHARVTISAPDAPAIPDAKDEFIALLWIAECAPEASNTAIIAMFREGEAEADRMVRLPAIWRAVEAVVKALNSHPILSGEKICRIIKSQEVA
jgi:hypothetical protein